MDENVFAYSNRFNDERGLVIYHNHFADTRGWIKTSAAFMDKATGDLRQKSLAEGLGLPFDGYVIFKDYVTHLEYIRSCEEIWEKGMYIELDAYQCHAFMDWRFVEDERWAQVHDALNGGGAESMQAKWDELFAVAKEKPAAKKRATRKPAKPRAAGKTRIAAKTAKTKTGAKGKPAGPPSVPPDPSLHSGRSAEGGRPNSLSSPRGNQGGRGQRRAKSGRIDIKTYGRFR